MAIDKLNPVLIETAGASDGDALVYVSANDKLEFGSVAVDTSSLSTSINTVQDNVATNATSITNNKTISDTLGTYANTTFATDTNLNVVQDNVATNASSITAINTNINTVQDNVATNATSITNNKTISDTLGTYSNSTFATTSYVDTEVAGIVDSAPATLDTLNELAAALGNDANLSVTLTNQINSISSNTDAVNSELDVLGTYANSTFATDTNLNVVQDNVATNASSITAINTNINTVQDNVATNATSITNNKTISDTLGTYANATFATGNVTAIQSNVTALQSDLGAFSTYANATFVTTVAANVASDNYAVDASTNTFTLVQSISNVNNIFVILDGLIQSPDTYTVNDTTLTISNVAPLPAGINVDVRYLQFIFPGTIDGGGV